MLQPKESVLARVEQSFILFKNKQPHPDPKDETKTFFDKNPPHHLGHLGHLGHLYMYLQMGLYMFISDTNPIINSFIFIYIHRICTVNVFIIV